MIKTVMCSTVLGLAILAGSAQAQTKKETECGYQGDIVAAIQQARMNKVSEKKVPDTVLAGEVTWPERFNAAIPIFTGEIYKLKMRDLRKTDLGKQWLEACLAN